MASVPAGMIVAFPATDQLAEAVMDALWWARSVSDEEIYECWLGIRNGEVSPLSFGTHSDGNKNFSNLSVTASEDERRGIFKGLERAADVVELNESVDFGLREMAEQVKNGTALSDIRY